MIRGICLVAVIYAGCASCGVSIAPPYLLDTLKVVAIVAEPPEIAPGQTTLLRAFIAAPQTPHGPLSTHWSFCQEHNPEATRTDCVSPTMLQQDEPVRLADGIFSVTTTLHADPQIFADVPEVLMRAGFWIQVGVVVNTAAAQPAQALKRVVVSNGVYPRNTNPQLHKVDVWDAGTRTGFPATVHPGDAIELVPDFAEDAFEGYQVLATDGTWQPRVENARFTWYSSQGQLNSWLTTGNRSILWDLPRSTTKSTQQFLAVLRDGRGGTAAWVQEVVVQ